ncbi:MAG: hypothetical protein NTZ33_03345 [Bacteroidetes bacterium]|nr:hypothetical protein [Bacteroidota bacterium]
MEKATKINRFTPQIKTSNLLIIAGIVWFSVGLMLCNFAYHWMTHYEGKYTLLIVFLGLVFAVAFAIFKFKHFADKNIKRIQAKAEKSCAFSFMSWQTYIIVAFMMTGGIMLRHSSLPKEYLSILYIGIGGALSLSSFRYFSIYFTSFKK